MKNNVNTQNNYNQKKKHRKRKLPAFLISVLIIFFLTRTALYDELTIRRYSVESPHVSEKHTFVLITDLHSTFYGENQEKLIEKIVRENPEAIFLSGDIADDKRTFDGTKTFLKRISEFYQCYYVAGNHECWVDYTEDIKSLITECGVTVVSNLCFNLGDGIRLFGVDDPLFYRDNGFRKALSSFDTSGEYFDILLSHRPEYAEEYAEYGFELTLSGHAHGGQVRLPLILNGLYAPNQGWFPKYAGGMYSFGKDSQMIVSRGLMLDDLPRIFNPPEIVVVTVE